MCKISAILFRLCAFLTLITQVEAKESFHYDVPGNLTTETNVVTVALPQFQQVVPQFIGVVSNGLVGISVPVTGVGPITFQWLLNSAPVSGATNDSFVIANATTTNLGNYQLVAANGAGAVTSAVMNVSFFDPSGNRLPLAWELYYFGTNGLSAYADPYKTGATLFQDYTDGFNPTNTDSANSISTGPITWVNTNGGNWSVPINWGGGFVPSPANSPSITIGGTYTVTLDVPEVIQNLTVGGSIGVQTLSIPSGQTLSLLGNGNFNSESSLNMETSTLMVGNGGQLTLAGQSINSNGTIVVGSGGLLTVTGSGTNSNAVFELDSGVEMAVSGSISGSETIQTVADSSVDMTEGGSSTWAGQVTGSGAGTVWLSSGTLNASPSLILNFEPDLFLWNGGALAGITTNAGTIKIAGTNASLLSHGGLFNERLVQQTGAGGLRFYTSGPGNSFQLFNLPGATYQITTDSPIYDDGNPAIVLFQNQGLLWKSGGTNTTTVSVPFNNLGGSIEVDSGTLVLAGSSVNGSGSSSNGTLNVAAGAALDLTGGNSPTWAGQVTGTGAGMVLLSSGTLNASPSSTLDFTNGPFIWDGGALAGTITNAGTIKIAGTSASLLSGAKLFNAGLVQQTGSGGLHFYTTGPGNIFQFYNLPRATYQITTDSPIFEDANPNSAFFQNQGLFWKSGGTNTTTVSVPFNNLGGSIEVDSGTLVLAGSSVNGGSNYSQGGGAFTVQLEGAMPGQYGQLVCGPATLAGPLNVKIAGGFVPAIGNQFLILVSSSLSGTFSPLNLPAGISISYSNNSAFLTVTGAVPVQLTAPQLVGGAGGNFEFDFVTASNQNYTIQSSTNLSSSNWLQMTNITGNGSLYQFILPVTNIPQRFFRVGEP